MQHRLGQLDGIRGIAALVVVLHHYVTALPDDQHAAWGWLFRFPPLRLFVAGHAAVIIFFVLSGCVLSLAYRRPTAPTPHVFLAKRLLRLYPTYAAAILVALGLHYAAVRWGSATWSGTMAAFWNAPPTEANLSGAFLLSGTTSAIDIDSPSWSLVHEMRLALLLPLLLPLTIAFPGRTLAAGATLSVVTALCLPLVGVHDQVLIGADNVPASLLISLYYACFFALGAWLPTLFGQGPVVSISRPSRALLLIVALCLLQLPQSMPLADVAFAVAAAVLIGLGLTGYFGILDTAPVQAVGKRSFSLYLVHFPALQLAYAVLEPGHPVVFLFAYLAMTLVLTLLLYEAVERPCAYLCTRIRQPERQSAVGRYRLSRSSRDI